MLYLLLGVPFFVGTALVATRELFWRLLEHVERRARVSMSSQVRVLASIAFFFVAVVSIILATAAVLHSVSTS